VSDLERDRAAWKGDALPRNTKAVIIGIIVFAVIGAVMFRLAL